MILFLYDHIGSFQYHFKSLYSGIIWYPPQCLFKSLAPTVSSFGSWVFQSQIQAFLRHTAFAQQKWSNNAPLDRAESGRIHGHTAIPRKIRKAGMFPRCEYASFCTLKFEAIWTFCCSKTNRFPLNSCNSMTSTLHTTRETWGIFSFSVGDVGDVTQIETETSCCRHDVLHQASCRQQINVYTHDYSLIVITTELDRLYL